MLGIGNLSAVRASNLSELVYKQGQAGVTKASVSITFDNTDAENSPIGYEDCEEIIVTRTIAVGGRNKYIINGRNANRARVKNLFMSVGLNIDNPHFLIMQGRITQVLNMKPVEILGMIEEAAGTRMFELKKKSALDTISKKERKVDEIQRVIDEDISPTLDKLRKERKMYIQWSENKTELERVDRLVTAYEYAQLDKAVSNAAETEAEMEGALAELEAEGQAAQTSLSEYDALIEEVRAQRSSELEGEFKDLEVQVRDLSKMLVKASSEADHAGESVTEAQAKLASILASIEEAKASLVAKREEAVAFAGSVAEATKKAASAQAKVSELEGQLQGAGATLASGSGDDDGVGANSFTAQIGAAKAESAKAAAAIERETVKINVLKDELATKRPALEASAAELASLHKQLKAGQRAVDEAKAALEDMEYDENAVGAAEEAVAELEAELRPLRESLAVLESKLARCTFEYSDPVANFDRSKVKGIVGELVTVTAPEAMTALEVTAGGKLFNVVVDTEVTGAALLKKGKLRRRVTIIPLNKISGSSLSEDVVARAQDLVGEDNVRPALSLVGYDDEVEAAMQYVFGKSFVVSDMVTAKKVTFDKSIRTKSVTLDGDVFDPAGTLTGGASRRPSASILAALDELSRARIAVADKEDELAEASAQLAEARSKATMAQGLLNTIALKEHELTLAKNAAASSPQQVLFDEIAEAEAGVAEANEAIDAAEEVMAACASKIERLETAMSEFADDREAKVASIEKELKSAKTKAAKASKKAKAAEQSAKALEMEAEEMEGEITELEASVSVAKEEIGAAEAGAAAASESLAKAKGAYEEKKSALDSQVDRMAAADSKLASLKKSRSKAASKMDKVSLAVKRAQTDLKNFSKKMSERSSAKTKMERKHEWIVTEKHMFGRAGSDFDFEAHNISKLSHRKKQLQGEQQILNKTINPKVMSMFEQAEQEYQDLKRKKRIIENDKAKIEKVITELDERKNEALNKTWAKVNEDFGDIFSTLLPGTSAKLEPPEGQTVLDGLCVKVAFNGLWKDSLSELSGGQRSLLALSLILSMLLFKPAPFYILDEIDAALDLSMTQRIGRVLGRFNAQFIVVSLKEGLFSSANVLFQVSFVDGTSVITRTVKDKSGKFTAQAVDENSSAGSNRAGPSSSSSSSSSSTGGLIKPSSGKRLRA